MHSESTSWTGSLLESPESKSTVLHEAQYEAVSSLAASHRSVLVIASYFSFAKIMQIYNRHACASSDSSP